MSAEPHKIGDLKKDPLYSQHTHQGINAIFEPQGNEPVYIGKTNDGDKGKGLADRIWDHASKNSELQRALGVQMEQFREFQVRTMGIDEPIQRGLAELYGIAIHKPRANKVANLAAIPIYDERRKDQQGG